MRGRKKKPVQIPVSFGAYPAELRRWRQAARAAARPLSWWIRHRLLDMEAYVSSQVSAPETPIRGAEPQRAEPQKAEERVA